MNEALAAELIRMAKADLQLKAELAPGSSLFEGYSPKMKLLHDKNAKRLSEIVDQAGWPGKSIAGEEAAHAAWLILQHAISHPQLQRKCFPLLAAQVNSGDVSAIDVAMLEDRIRAFEGRPQRFGTQFDWDENKQMSPLPLDNYEHVEQRRKHLGMRTMQEEIMAKRKEVMITGEKPPADYPLYQQEKEKWLKANGWR